MIYDGHIHIGGGAPNKELFLARLADAGVAGGAVISLSPACFREGRSGKDDARERLDGLFARTEGCAELLPLFWIDPLEGNALEQVEIARGYGVAGFKVICDRYYPYDVRPMEVFSRIAEAGKPILFHSGILWDGKFSSPYNRPAGFEALLGVGGGLRFALAHASWPWIDECIALYGKMLNARSEGNGTAAEMFIDITPGTPEIYREELLTKLFTVGYDIEDNVIFGSDCNYDDYNAKWVRGWADRDAAIYARLKLGKDTVGKVFSGNLKRFLGLAGGKRAYRSLTSADS
jgi:predicted TIM-barrel fold metal-dependent hydrolase